MPFGNNLYIQGKVWALRDQMVLKNGVTNEPVAVCLRKFELIGQTFKIYSVKPVYPGQKPSVQTYKHYKLYTFASVERDVMLRSFFFDNKMVESPVLQSHKNVVQLKSHYILFRKTN